LVRGEWPQQQVFCANFSCDLKSQEADHQGCWLKT